MLDIGFIDRLKSGDENAFRELLSVYGKPVVNLCYRFLLNQQDAEDIAQEVFVEVFQHVKQFKNQSALQTWIHRIAVSRCIDQLRKQKNRKKLSRIFGAFGLESIENIQSHLPQPDQLLEERQSIEALRKALDQLPENQRIAITLSKESGYSSAEIAEILDIRTAAVDALIYRARKKLSEILNKNVR